MNDTKTDSAPTFYPSFRYRDAVAAIDWLERAFGFERQMVVPGPDGTIAHAQMRFGNGLIMLGSLKDDVLGDARSAVYVYVPDVDKHAAGARSAGAEIVVEPHDTDYGSREYAARDFEGGMWYFGTYRPA